MVENNKQIHVMHEFRGFLRIYGAYRMENFRGKDPSELWNNIGLVVITTVMNITLVLLIILGCWYCVDHKFVLSELAATVPVSLHSLQYFLAYISLAMRYEKIKETTEHLKSLTKQRKRNMSKSASFSIYL